jgi:RNA polymerase sigma factor (sigma-70 family)
MLLLSVTLSSTRGRNGRLQCRRMNVGATLRRVVDGDERAWDEIVEQYGGLVWSVARSYRLGALTDDVVQTVWLRLAEYCDRIREPDRLAAWLATTTRNEALRVLKKQKRVLSVGELPERIDPSVSTLDEIVTDDDTLAHVLEAFRRLPEKDQELLRLLCTVPPLDYASIADLLGRSIGSIGPSRDRSLKKLRKLLPSGLHDEARKSSRKDSAE